MGERGRRESEEKTKKTIIVVIAAFIVLAAAISGAYLFSMDTVAKLEDDLNKGIISEELKKEFKSKGFPLSDNVGIRKINDFDWSVYDKEKRRLYAVTKEDGKLNIEQLGPIFKDEPGTIVAYLGGPNVTFPPIPSNLSLIPTTVIGYSDFIPGRGAKDVPLNTCISVSFWRPPHIVKLETEPEVEISHVKKEYVDIASGRFTFYPAEPLQPEINYTVKITFGTNKFPDFKRVPQVPYETISWDFTTTSITVIFHMEVGRFYR